jgi:hypothetical protein
VVEPFVVGIFVGRIEVVVVGRIEVFVAVGRIEVFVVVGHIEVFVVVVVERIDLEFVVDNSFYLIIFILLFFKYKLN